MAGKADNLVLGRQFAAAIHGLLLSGADINLHWH
jgi:hypothetical protein